MSYFNFLLSFCVFFFLTLLPVKSDVVNYIEISGNERVSSETIKMFMETNINDDSFNKKSYLLS